MPNRDNAPTKGKLIGQFTPAGFFPTVAFVNFTPFGDDT
jgi:hypothetical protein